MDASFANGLAATYDTPFYAYDLSAVACRTQELMASLPEGARLFHSFKANPLPPVAEEIRLGGAQAEITSLGELHAARLAGHDLTQALYGGPGKKAAEIAAALNAGVRWFSCESWQDLKRLSEAATAAQTEVQILLRVNPAEAPDARLAMTGVESQFGFDESLLTDPEARAKVRQPGICLRGVHVYFGTQVASVGALTANTRRALETAVRLEAALDFECTVINAGGGFPWPYANNAPVPALKGLREELTTLWQASPLYPKAQLWFEAGRYLCAAAGTLVTRVLDVKPSRTRTFVVLDTGIHHLGGMAGLGRIPRSAVTFQNLSRSHAGEMTADIVGPLCTPLDSLARGLKLPVVEAGDLLAVPNVGAYGLTASLVAFLSHPAPVEISYREGEMEQVWRWRSGHQQLFPAEIPY
ncbi:diaminopimelate decarboxylase [Prosthecobacter fusiformis]|uniref:Diaminopimelate decarboxylase n=1 Tax=Prosthecobacter fusiformis TaxID=48464 RepID=A0A4R7RI95_9BACT|nr:type III PLP-dependent enzyme [Prosthecobacter fusiformis]TDU62515.1 diaminopimelate decarboxylase [Prosthecobacter fusiformis]